MSAQAIPMWSCKSCPPQRGCCARLFAYEIRNSVLIGLRRKRITKTEAETFLNSIQDLPIHMEDPESYGALFQLADKVQFDRL